MNFNNKSVTYMKEDSLEMKLSPPNPGFPKSETDRAMAHMKGHQAKKQSRAITIIDVAVTIIHDTFWRNHTLNDLLACGGRESERRK